MIATRDATVADLPAIDTLYREQFVATFGHLYESHNLDAFFERFTREAWQREFDSPDFAFRVAEGPDGLVGYCKIGPMDLPSGAEGEAPVELYQLYLREAAKGNGVSDALMQWAYDKARAFGGTTLYLSVFTDNHRARRFYLRHGFVEVGPYAFMVGDHEDADIIMKRPL